MCTWVEFDETTKKPSEVVVPQPEHLMACGEAKDTVTTADGLDPGAMVATGLPIESNTSIMPDR